MAKHTTATNSGEQASGLMQDLPSQARPAPTDNGTAKPPEAKPKHQRTPRPELLKMLVAMSDKLAKLKTRAEQRHIIDGLNDYYPAEDEANENSKGQAS